MTKAAFDGCTPGLVAKSTSLPIRKPWSIATTATILLHAFGSYKCPGSADHTPCAGSETRAPEVTLLDNQDHPRSSMIIKATSAHLEEIPVAIVEGSVDNDLATLASDASDNSGSAHYDGRVSSNAQRPCTRLVPAARAPLQSRRSRMTSTPTSGTPGTPTTCWVTKSSNLSILMPM